MLLSRGPSNIQFTSGLRLRGTFLFTALIRNRIEFWILTHFVNFSPSLPLSNKKQRFPLIMIPPNVILVYLSIEFTADSMSTLKNLQPFPLPPIFFTVCSCVVRGCVSQVTLVTGLKNFGALVDLNISVSFFVFVQKKEKKLIRLYIF